MDTGTATDSAFVQALREAVEQRGLGLGRIAARLAELGTPLSEATLSYWQTGRSQPGRRSSMEALANLEQILQVEAGALSGQLDPAAVRGRHTEPPDPTWEELWEEVPEVAAAYGRLDTSREDHLTRVSYHDKVRVGPGRAELGLWTKQVMRAERDGVDRFIIMHGTDDPALPASQIRALERCTVGRTSPESEAGVITVEMLLPRPLERGELIAVTYEFFRLPPYPVAERHERRRRSPNKEYILEVLFDPEDLPVSAQTYIEPVEGDLEVRDVVPDPEHGLLLVELDGLPGVIGARWTWEKGKEE